MFARATNSCHGVAAAHLAGNLFSMHPDGIDIFATGCNDAGCTNYRVSFQQCIRSAK